MRGIKTNRFIGIIVAGALTLVMSSIPSHVNAANSPILDSNGKTFSTLDDAIQNGSGHIILQDFLVQLDQDHYLSVKSIFYHLNLIG